MKCFKVQGTAQMPQIGMAGLSLVPLLPSQRGSDGFRNGTRSRCDAVECVALAREGAEPVVFDEHGRMAPYIYQPILLMAKHAAEAAGAGGSRGSGDDHPSSSGQRSS